MANIAFIGVIFIGIALGFVLGQRSSFSQFSSIGRLLKNKRKPKLMRSLANILSEESDEAIDQFISGVEVRSDTLDLHLGLAATLRRKGELERAIRVHQHVSDQPSLSFDEHISVRLELAKDYLEFGFFDRAEKLLQEVASQSGVTASQRINALKQLIDVYQDTKDWLKAIEIADQLTSRKFSDEADVWRCNQAQYACELAEAALHAHEIDEASRWVRNALKYDSKCARASVLQAEIDIRENRIPAAIASLDRIPQQNPSLATLVVPPLIRCYMILEDDTNLEAKLRAYLEHHADRKCLVKLCDIVERRGGYKAVLEVLAKCVGTPPESPDKSPQLYAVVCFLREARAQSGAIFRFGDTLKALLHSKREYHCTQCGFVGSKLHWCCPKCKSWGAAKYQDSW